MKRFNLVLVFVLVGLFSLSGVFAGWGDIFNGNAVTGNVVSEGVTLGKCITLDSDGGKNVSAAGSFNYSQRWWYFNPNPVSVADSCYGANILTEYWCADGLATRQEITCENGCREGVCLQQSSPTCTDYDNGNNPTNASYVVRISSVREINNQHDTCTWDRKLNEKYCNPDGTIGNTEYACADSCTTVPTMVGGQNLSLGKCTPQETTCSENDGGNIASIKGVTIATATDGTETRNTDECGLSGNLKEYYCSNNQVVSVNVACSNGDCSSGACASTSPVCTDSDSGQDYSVKGIVNTAQGNVSDYCVSPSFVGEFFCRVSAPDGLATNTSNADQRIYRQVMYCTNGCSMGVCIGGEASVPTADILLEFSDNSV